MDNREEFSSRTNRNAKLYREVYGKYNSTGNLPIEDNTSEIDMESLKSLICNESDVDDSYINKSNLNILEQTKRNFSSEKIYDINEMLKKAKDENNKINTSVIPSRGVVNKNILSTLTNNELLLEDIKKEQLRKNYEEDSCENDDLYMTREIKYSKLQDAVEGNDELKSMMFDKMANGTNKNESEDVKKIKSDIHSSDTTDIDIIKSSKDEENFFTSSYEFSKKDFAVDDDFFGDDSKGGIFKIILLILFIFIFIGVIVYFIMNYGM